MDKRITMKPIYAIIGIAVLSVAACSRDVSSFDVEKKKTFTAYLETSATTRTAMGEKDAMDKYPVYWSADDKIRIYTMDCLEGEGREFILTSGAGTSEGVFTGMLPDEEDGTYIALYPFNLCSSLVPAPDTVMRWTPNGYESFISLPVPQVQRYKEGTFDINSFPAMAITENEVLKFKNLGGILKLNFTGNVKIGKIDVKDLNKTALWGTMFVSLDGMNDPDYIPVMRDRTDGWMGMEGWTIERPDDKNMIILSCGNSGVQLASDNATSFLLVVPAGSFSKGFVATVYDTNGNPVKEFSTTVSNTIKRNTITSMPVQDISGVPTYTDLSVNGTANSYMVKPDEGTYRFFAGVKGNSVSPVVGGKTVDVLWETRMSNTIVTEFEDIINSVSLENDGYISFKTTNVAGNAIIAIKNSQDEVLWSWHIWSTNYDPSVSSNCDTYTATGAVLMNRNLGAIPQYPDSKTENLEAGDYVGQGLRYQWGRKDPFLYYDTKDNGFIAYSYPHAPFTLATTSNENVTSFASLHPTYVINTGSDWWYETDRLWSSDKTIHDPCPPGYKVADFETFYNSGYFDAKEHTYALTGGISYVQIGSQYVDNVAYFPAPTDGVYTNKAYRGRSNCWPMTSFNLLAEYYASDMKQVRCQRENTGTPMEYIDLSSNGTANSYIAKPGGKYKFKADVKGNSNEIVGSPSTAFVAWQTLNTDNADNLWHWNIPTALVSDRTIQYRDGYIYFETATDQSRNGNAIIVLENDNREIIWSWHIWVTDYDPDNSYVVVDGGTANPELKMMDRNLGALTSQKHAGTGLGLLYQWGRKDPFFGPYEYTSSSIASYYQGDSEFYEILNMARDERTGTVSYSVHHPMHFIFKGGEDDGNWLNESIAGLWGEEKTKYDPCPPGWKVPVAPHWGTDKTAVGIFEIGLSTTAKDKDGYAATVWYPASGYLNAGSKNITKVGCEGHYWYASPRDAGTAYSFKFDKDNIILNSNYDEKAQGNSVRCVKDE